MWGYYFLDEAKKTEIFINIKLSGEKLRVQVGSTITLDEHAQLIGNIDDSIKKKFGLYFSFEPFKERILHKSKATEFAFIKEHNDYDIMKNTESMEELHKELSSFFTVFFEMLKSGLKS